MKYKALGNSGLTLSAVTLGCMTFTGDSNWGPQDEKDSVETIRAALDSGVTSFDTAESYAGGLTEVILGKALGADRSRVVIQSKVSNSHLNRADMVSSLENTLKRLGTDYLDLYQIHWPSADSMDEALDTLTDLKKQGKIRAIGVSNFGIGDLDRVLGKADVVSNQMAYNLLFRGIEYSIMGKCHENGIGILTYSSLGQGLLSGKYKTADDFPVGRARTKIFNSAIRQGARHGGAGCEELAFSCIDKIREICLEIGQPMEDVALAWSLSRPEITSVIAGARTPAQAIANAKAGDLTLAPDVIEALNRATEPIKEFIGDDADPWAYGRIH
ncbi:MAG: aldo/keto reductase [Clostridia bacterium]|nr:aldo/keto reductase [Clostridia bacterium]